MFIGYLLDGLYCFACLIAYHFYHRDGLIRSIDSAARTSLFVKLPRRDRFITTRVDSSDDPLSSAKARLDDTLETLHGAANDPAMMLAARNAIVALGGLARFGASATEMARAVERTCEAVRKHLDPDPGEALTYPLLDARAAALAEVVREHGDLDRLDAEDRTNWLEEAYEIMAARDAADAWLLGAAALLRALEPGEQRTNLERTRERAVAMVARFDRALEPALVGLSPLREAAQHALARARADRSYVRRARYWARILEATL